MKTTKNKPTVQLTGVNGNVFSIIGTMTRSMKRQGFRAEAEEFSARAMNADSYDAVLVMCHEYADIE
jgi:hypothetical protein